MIVLGAGPVGSELAQAWSTLGTKVTLVEGGDRILAREEPFAGEQVAAALRGRHGVDVRTGARPSGSPSRRLGRGRASTTARGSTPKSCWSRSAASHGPRNRAGLGRRRAGRAGFLETDDRMRVGGSEWLYAVGDVNGRALFTHMGKYQAWVAAENVLGTPVEAIAEAIGSPRVTFTDPQVAAVGRTLEQAEEAGIDADADRRRPPTARAGASFYGKETGGTTRIVVDRERETIVGATFTGFETADFLQAATIAIVGEVPLTRLRHAVAAYPTRSEIWLKLIEEYGGEGELGRRSVRLTG